AEFDNYRKRVARDQHELAARAHERLVRELVPVLDDLERALEFATAHEEAQLEDGVRLVHRSLADALAKEGLAEIPTEGKFDPHTQEALLSDRKSTRLNSSHVAISYAVFCLKKKKKKKKKNKKNINRKNIIKKIATCY